MAVTKITIVRSIQQMTKIRESYTSILIGKNLTKVSGTISEKTSGKRKENYKTPETKDTNLV